MPRAEQLLLNLRPRPDARLDDFAGPAYDGLRDAALRFLSAPDGLLFIHGPAGSGRSHFLSALCASAGESGGSAVLLPFADLVAGSPDVLAGLEAHDLVACDDVDALRGLSGWEEALFHLFNRVRAAGRHLAFSAALPPRETGFHLPDLASRMAQAPCWALPLPDDGSREELLQRLALRRALDLEPEVLRYLAERGPRTPGGLAVLVERLDRQSLQAGRRLTIPFVRLVLEAAAALPGGA